MVLTVALLHQPEYLSQINALAAHLQLPVVTVEQSSAFAALLHFSPQHSLSSQPALALSLTAQPQWQPFAIDFCAGAISWRREHGGGELLVRAVQGRKKDAVTVLDATAGLGRDSFILASHGFSVQMCERNPVVCALLDDALQRARHSADNTADSALLVVIDKLLLCHGDVRQIIARLHSDHQQPDVIYLDPMFPESKNSALVKKDMQIFHQLVGADSDGSELLLPARQLAAKRVVVKRPIKADYLAGEKPAYQLSGKAIRFDIYLPHH